MLERQSSSMGGISNKMITTQDIKEDFPLHITKQYGMQLLEKKGLWNAKK